MGPLQSFRRLLILFLSLVFTLRIHPSNYQLHPRPFPFYLLSLSPLCSFRHSSSISKLQHQGTVFRVCISSRIEADHIMVLNTARAPIPIQRQRCAWCDAFGHFKSECQELLELLRLEKVVYNGKRRLAHKESGIEFPFGFGKGGMRVFHQRVVYWVDMLEKDSGYDYFEAVRQYQKRIEELMKTFKTFGEEYWPYVDPIPPRPPQ